MVGRPQRYGQVFHHISKLVLLEMSVWVLGTLHGVYKARRSAAEPSQEGGWCGEEKVWTLGKQGGGSLFRVVTHTDLRRWVWCIANVGDVKPMGMSLVGDFFRWVLWSFWKIPVNLLPSFGPCESRKVLPPNANHQWLITSSYGLVSWRGGIGRGTLWFAWWLPWSNSRGRYLPSANLHGFKPSMTAVAPLSPKATCCSHFHSFHLYCPAPASGGAWSAGRKDTKLQGNPGDDMLKFISCPFSLWMTRDDNGGDGGEHDAGSFF